MVAALLWRGMLVGLVAGILCFAFLRFVGEPRVDRAIAFEEQSGAAAHGDAHADHSAATASEPEVELVSRTTQAGIGLFTAVAVYGAATGGLFALAFALAYRRIGEISARATAALLAAAAFISVSLVPFLKYPANPPAVVDPETIGARTALYFSMIALSLAAAVAAGMVRNRFYPRLGAWTACLAGIAAYVVAVIVAGALLPTVNEVPEHFPAGLLWEFRIVSIGSQLLLWAVLGVGFGLAAERVLPRPSMVPATAAGSARRVMP